MTQYPNSSSIIIQIIDSMFKIQTFLVGALLVLAAHSFSFKLLSSDPVCFKIAGNDRYILEYVSSGDNDKNVQMEVFENSRSIFLQEDRNDFSTTLQLGQGKIDVCFKRTDNKEKDIVFEFYKEDDPIKGIIDRKDLSQVIRSFSKAIQSLKEVSKNQQFHIERDEINRIILEESESRIKWTGIVKITFLLVSALIQLWIMKSFFKQNSVPYQPVDQ